MYILPTSPETEQQRFIERRKLYRSQSSQKRQSCATLAYLLLFYFITLFVVPALLILNIAIFVKEWDVFTATRDGTEVVCHNAVYSLVGYIVIYALLLLWIIVYAILNTQTCNRCIAEGGGCAQNSEDAFSLFGFLVFIGLIAYNLAVSYWATERSFVADCGAAHPALHRTVIADVVVTHVAFDLFAILMLPKLVQKYQWL